MIKPILRMLLAPVRSGTTAFIHTVAQHQFIETATFLMKNNIFYDSNSTRIDYSIYSFLSHNKYLVYKATFGYKLKQECTYDPFRNDDDIILVKPLFMFRDPIQTYNSWKKLGWGNLDLFILTYKHVKKLYNRCTNISPNIKCITYEHLSRYPKEIFEKVFNYWEMPFKKDVLIWKYPIGQKTIKFGEDREASMQRRFLEDIEKGIYNSIINGPQTFCYKFNQIIISKNEISIIEKELTDIYEELFDKSNQYWIGGIV